ncbi:AfsR/SARP family transcriptional regulator [Acrocarpospora catenulata]|uniref:AfsR/SARP family transcriptional regulator n=1 Tax=Acrocarpospora catenulata TaxID=2836182 RepID=UPI001BDB33D8|nr:AfsR/SARP family transcriptional regulator [Acrocarpospora catenulata]
MNSLAFRLFGPFEVGTADGTLLELGPRKQRAVLALLALDPGRIVSLDRLVDELWDDATPSSAIGTLQAYISHLRRALEPDRPPRSPATVLVTREPGYLLAIKPAQVDLIRFTTDAEEGRQALSRRAYGAAMDAFDRALATWRGEPLAEFAGYGFAQPVIARLTELQAAVTEDRFEARLALGDSGSAVADLERLVEAYPYRERLWGLLVLALYRAGRQAEALGALRRVRTLLADDLGLEPGPELRRLEQAVFEQSAALDAPAPPAAAPARPQATLIARDSQLRRIGERVAEAVQGRGGVVLVVGEAGIGKTRLAQTAAEAAGIRVAWGRCVEADAAPAFWPWAQALRELGAAETVQLLATGSGQVATDLDAALFELYDQVLAALNGEPVLVVLDDLHSADAASLRLLRYVARELHRRPVLVLATLRPEPGREPEQLAETLAALTREPGTERLRLPPFTRDEVAAFLGGQADRELAGKLHQRTGGNPFYLGELVRLLDSEQLEEVPETVREVLSRRVARLPAGTQELLRTAAVLGREVRLEVLATAAETPQEEVMAGLAPAVATGLLAETPDGFDYRFSHVLVCDALYAGLDRLARARLHLRAGEALAAGNAPLPVLAHHFALAARVGGAARAVSYASQAARQATAQLAFDEAVVLWRTALAAYGEGEPGRRCELLIELGRAQRVTGDVTGAHATLAEAIALAEATGDRAAMAEATMVFGGVTVWNWRVYGTVDDHMVAVLEDLLAGELPDEQRAALLGTLGLELYYGPRRAEGERHAAEAVEIARRLGDPVLLARTLNNFINAAWISGREQARLAAAEEMLSLPSLSRSTELVARIMRMVGLLELGRVEEWHTELARCRRLVAEVRQPDLAAMVWVAESTRAAMAGRWTESERLTAEYGRLLDLTTMWGLVDCRLATLFTSRWAQGRAGELAGALTETAEEAIHAPMRPMAVLATFAAGDVAEARRLTELWSCRLPSDWSTGFVTAGWGLVAARLGMPDPRAMYDRLAPFADQLVVMGSQVVCWGSVHQVLAELAAALDEPALAREHATQALAVHDRLGLTALTSPATLALGVPRG